MIFPLIRFASFVFFARPSSAIISCHQQQQKAAGKPLILLFICYCLLLDCRDCCGAMARFLSHFIHARALSLSLSGAV
jgi:hypothetical protein